MTDEGTLAALRLADSALPVGGYAVSYGLEQFVQDDVVTDTEALHALLVDYLRGHLGPCEFVVLAAAHRAGTASDLDGVATADRRQRAVTLPAEFREGSTASGRRLLDVMTETTGDDAVAAYADRVSAGEVPGNYAAVLGLVTARLDVPRDTACLVHGHSFLTGMLGAAQRLLRLGHTEIQTLLHDLHPLVADVQAANEGTDLAAAQSFAPMIDLLGMAHERADRRLFVS